MSSRNGFVVASWAAKGRVLATGRLESGESFALAARSDPGALFVPLDYGEAAERILARFGAERDEEAWCDMDGSPRLRFFVPGGAGKAAERALLEGGVALPVLDRGGVDAFFAERGIASGIAIGGEGRKGDRVDLLFVDPELGPAELQPVLCWLALDIETDRQNRVLAVSLIDRRFGRELARESAGPRAGDPRSGAEGQASAGPGHIGGEVLFWGPELGLPWVRCFDDEAALLRALDEEILRRDPDVITGWNIIEFDLAMILARHEALGIPFAIGRSRDGAAFVERPGKSRVFDLPGRSVLDGIRLMRSAGERYEDQSLETVAQAVLGEGKTVASKGEDKLAELDRLRTEEPALFCEYCLRDSELVLRILEKTGIAALTARRAALTGLPLDLAWTSIPAFERVYDAALRARRIVAPGRELRSVSGAAGGTVLDPRAGLFEGVVVLDFRSLYPSIIRTFNIDPLSHALSGDRAFAHAGVRGARKLGARGTEGEPRSGADGEPRQEPDPAAGGACVEEGDGRAGTRFERGCDEERIMAPNGAKFARAEGILPGVIARYTAEREAALARGDDTGAYVYKILMNSFYGVLGAEGCRYARTELAGAITSFARKYLTFARDFIEAAGYRVLYGDTDSVFVETGLGGGAGYAKLSELGTDISAALNGAIAADIRAGYGLESFLRIRPDKIYARFLIPRLRFEGNRQGGLAILGRDEGGGSRGGGEAADGDPAEEGGEGEARGRAKGYAGLRLSEGGGIEVEVRGMEAARSDGTALGRRFQRELLAIVFGEGSAGLRPGSRGEAEAYCRSVAAALRGGELDEELVYRRWLRRPASEYGAENPAVRAARLLGWTHRRGRIAWVMTKGGAEPPELRSPAAIDYEHYAERQLLPIAISIGDEAGWDPRPWLADRPQMELW
ncbi:MAG TPA: DNA polymerase domain-containing protein [Rectinemataceae bacterium]|nr:DNA polymerase domain-containing protein [Rectinemataceae bacterium]